MKVAIIDADLIGRWRHRFPNLACEKLAGYWKTQGANVELKLDYAAVFHFDYDHCVSPFYRLFFHLFLSIINIRRTIRSAHLSTWGL